MLTAFLWLLLALWLLRVLNVALFWRLVPELPAAATELVESITHPGHLADLIAANVDVTIEEKQQVLDTVDLKARMKLSSSSSTASARS